jgi:ankyrin repeat protein
MEEINMKIKILLRLSIAVFVLLCFSCNESQILRKTQSKTSNEQGSYIHQTNNVEQDNGKQKRNNEQVKNPKLASKLIKAIKAGNVDLVKSLLAQGASPNAIESGRYALDYALSILKHDLCESGKENCPKTAAEFVAIKKGIIQALLSSGADVNRDCFLHYAVQNTHNISIYDEEMDTPEEIELKVDIVKLLVDSGADVNKRCKNLYFQTPIFLTNNTKVLQILLKAGAIPNIRDEYGSTPLIWLLLNLRRYAEDLYLDAATLLVQSGADVNAKNKKLQTPMCLASFAGADKIVNLLRENGAKECPTN